MVPTEERSKDFSSGADAPELRAKVLDFVVAAYETGHHHAKVKSRLIVYSDDRPSEDAAVWIRRAADEALFSNGGEAVTPPPPDDPTGAQASGGRDQ